MSRLRLIRASHYRAALLLLSGCWLSVPAAAEESETTSKEVPEEGDYRDDARRLATEAAQRYEAGDYAAALDLFTRSGKLYDAPTLKFWQARCLEQLGRLVEAEARYAEVTRQELGPDAPEAFSQAQRNSATALTDLRKRLPTITILINNAKDISRVELDGRQLPAPLIGAPVAVDPGTHVVSVTRSSGGVQTESVAIVESQSQKVYVNFDKPSATPLDPLTEPSEAEPKEAASSWHAPVGWSLISLGAVGMGVGVVAGLQAMDKYHTLEENCGGGQCGSEYHSDVDSFNSLRRLSTVGYAVGFAGLAAGTVILLVDSSDESQTSFSVGPASAGVSHHF